MNPRNILFLIIFTLLMSCHSRQILDLNKIDKTFNVSDFYLNKIQTNDEKLECVKKNYKIDTLCFYNSKGRFLENEYITKKNNWSVRNDDFNSIFGYEYSSICWNESTKLAKMNNVYFQTISMLKSEKGEFIGLYAIKKISNKSTLIDSKIFLDNKYGNAKKIQGSFNKKSLEWETDELLIQIPIDEDKSYENSDNLTLFMLNKDYENQFKSIKIGKWIDIVNK